MARATATLDAFSVIAEPRRREVLGQLALGEKGVSGLVSDLGWPQPAVSKHLAVLLQVGLVNVRHEGRRRWYRVNGETLKTVYDWTRMFEGFWTSQLDRIKQRAEAKVSEQRREKGQ